jgi:hypothetical protein
MKHIDLDINESFHVSVNAMREVCEYYPAITVGTKGNDLYVGAYVRIQRAGVWHKIICVHAVNLGNDLKARLEWLTRGMEIFMESVHKIQNLYIISGPNPEVDSLQEQEFLRIMMRDLKPGQWGHIDSRTIAEKTEHQQYLAMLENAGLKPGRFDDNTELTVGSEFSSGSYYANFDLNGKFINHEFSSNFFSY